MSYNEIELEKIEPNPFQTRMHYDEEALAGIMSTASDNLGVRYAPIVRPHPKKAGYYQIASGHGRILALKALGRKTTTVKIIDLTDRQMKKEILVENVNRSDLLEDERFKAIESIRLDPDTDDQTIRKILQNKEIGWITELSKITGIPKATLNDIYDVKEMRSELTKVGTKIAEEATVGIIRATTGLEKEDRSKLILKADRRGWNRPSVQRVKKAIQQMEPKVRKIVLEEEQTLTPTVIEEISEIKDANTQETLIKQIKAQGLDERMAIQRIERAKEQLPITMTQYQNEPQEILDEFRKTADRVKIWGINQYMVLGETKWSQARNIFDEIEAHMRWLKRSGFKDNLR